MVPPMLLWYRTWGNTDVSETFDLKLDFLTDAIVSQYALEEERLKQKIRFFLEILKSRIVI